MLKGDTDASMGANSCITTFPSMATPYIGLSSVLIPSNISNGTCRQRTDLKRKKKGRTGHRRKWYRRTLNLIIHNLQLDPRAEWSSICVVMFLPWMSQRHEAAVRGLRDWEIIVCINLSVHLTVCLFVRLSVFPSNHLSLCRSAFSQSVCQSVCLPVCLSVCLSVNVSLCQFICVFVCLCFHVCVWVICLCLSVFRSACPYSCIYLFVRNVRLTQTHTTHTHIPCRHIDHHSVPVPNLPLSVHLGGMLFDLWSGTLWSLLI